MKAISVRAALASGLFLAAALRADADPAKPEPLPPPRVVPAPAPRVIVPMYRYSFPRVSRYAVWQNYGVDQTGHFRPLVIAGPYGSYYRYDHEPFPWTLNYTWQFTPTLIGSPPPR